MSKFNLKKLWLIRYQMDIWLLNRKRKAQFCVGLSKQLLDFHNLCDFLHNSDYMHIRLSINFRILQWSNSTVGKNFNHIIIHLKIHSIWILIYD